MLNCLAVNAFIMFSILLFYPHRVLQVPQVLRVWLVSVESLVCQDSVAREVSRVCLDLL